MRHVFPCPGIAPVEIPDRNLVGVYAIRSGTAAGSPMALIEAALDQPIGSLGLEAMARPGQQVLIVADDNTRTTRTELMVPAVIARLRRAGVAATGIRIFVALGTHRPMTDAELAAKFTAQVVSNHAFIQPDLHCADDYRTISQAGEPTIRIHKALPAADLVVGVGQTVPHLIAGFGGGCKIVNPGCADAQTIGRMHWLCSTVADGRLFAVRDNPVRELIDHIGLRAGLKFIINEVPGQDDALAGVFAGDPVQAHRQACAFARAACAVPLKQVTDIVISDAYPSDLDFWQSLKGLNAACAAVRPGGTVILATPCPEGVSAQHPELLEIGLRKSTDAIEALVQAGKLCPITAAAIWLGSRLAAHAQIILVSPGISCAQTQALGLRYAPDPDAALALALARHGPEASVSVLYKSAKMILGGP